MTQPVPTSTLAAKFIGRVIAPTPRGGLPIYADGKISTLSPILTPSSMITKGCMMTLFPITAPRRTIAYSRITTLSPIRSASMTASGLTVEFICAPLFIYSPMRILASRSNSTARVSKRLPHLSSARLRARYRLFPHADFRVPVDVIDVLAIVAVIIIAVLTNIEVIKSDSEDPGPHGGKVLASAAHRFAFAFPALDHEDYAVYEGRKDYRVAHADHRRRVYNDVIEAFAQRAQKLFHAFRTYQFGRVGRHITTREDRESTHRGSTDEIIRIAAACQEGG